MVERRDMGYRDVTCHASTGEWIWHNSKISTGWNPRACQDGITLRFTLDENDDNIADILKLYSGNAILANRPQLIVKYYVS